MAFFALPFTQPRTTCIVSRPGVTGLINETGERFNLAARDSEVEAELSPFSQVILGQGDHGADLGHDTLPGQGNATEASLVRSTFV